MSESLGQLVGRLAHAKRALADAEAEVRSVQSTLIAAMQESDERTVTGEDDGQVVTGTLVEPTKIVIDEKRLKKTIGATTFRKVTKEVLDKTKLENAVKEGLVDMKDVATSSDEVPIAAHVKITRK
jgi:hypothetical protein